MALQLVWIFWRSDSSIVSPKISTEDVPWYILVILLIMMPDTDLKIIKKSVLIN